MKKYFGSLIILPILLFSLSMGALALQTESVLVFDNASDSSVMPKKFRCNEGLDISASGQFSAKELKQLLQDIPAKPNKVWVIDLRQESHGFVNGIPVTWFSDQNSINKYKTPLQIARHEKALLQELEEQEKICVYTLKKLQRGKITAVNPVQIIPRLVQTEQELVNELGANYQRFYVLDHNRPDDINVDAYVSFIKNTLKPGDWMHFHCRGGKGRSSTFIAMYDMIHNAKHLSFDEIMQRQVAMGNIKLHMQPNKPEKIWKIETAKQRYIFLQKFYAYALDPDGYATHSWSEWLERCSRK
jgi:protein-tyrosine phosphatase